jgi:hypothetical protein
MADIWQTHDRVERTVVFTKAGHDHILARHGDIADWLDEVRLTIEQPNFVT